MEWLILQYVTTISAAQWTLNEDFISLLLTIFLYATNAEAVDDSLKQK